MTTEKWNPQAAKPAIAKLFRALPHLGRTKLETCGGITLDVEYDEVENALIAYDGDKEVWRVRDFIPE
ncbi:hypothetical protein ACJU26_04775 [Acidithiobacillus sp. M4-SHS-6]|uniref:hypothetical protein n=1 Tax=Acidithiobacillus sp. M4-SHS-6 TaxID=3383024 RepID=UPI0039BE100B